MFIVNECTFTGYNLINLDLGYLIAIWFEENVCLSTNLGIGNKPVQIYTPLPDTEFFVALGLGMAGFFLYNMLPRVKRTTWKNQIEARYFIIYGCNGEELRIFAHLDINDPSGVSLSVLHRYNPNVRFIVVIMNNRRWLAVCSVGDWSDIAMDDWNWNYIQTLVHTMNSIFQPFPWVPILSIRSPDLNYRKVLETVHNLEYVTGFDPYQKPIIDSIDHNGMPLVGVQLCTWSVLHPVVLCPEYR